MNRNPACGYTRIRGGLKHVGHDIARNTIEAILRDRGIEPAPERRTRMPWKTFLAAHWDGLAAADFFTIEALTMRGHVRLVLPARSPNLNAFAERFVESVKSECLNRMVPLGERHLRTAVREFVHHYHDERPHQGLGNKIIAQREAATGTGQITCRERLGGLLKFYDREAA